MPNSEVGGLASNFATESTDYGLVLSEVYKDYGHGPVLKGVDLEVKRGEFFTLLGPSGSGKTTILTLLAGFTDLDSGDIRLGSESLVRVPPHKRDIGLVFQNYSLFPHMSVFENICFPLRVRGLDAREMSERATEALSLVGMEAYGARYPSELSGGQQQRGALARAVVFEPSLLLMDEPLGALDRRLRVKMEVEIRNLHRRLGVTVLYVTHDQEEALSMADKIGVLSDGELVQVGSPRRVYERPVNRFVADFLGDSNLLSGIVRVIDEDNGWLDVEIGNEIRFRCFCSHPSTVGDVVDLVIRPEALVIAQAGGRGVASGSDDYGTPLHGVVKDVVYLGSHVKFWVSLDSGTELMAIASGFDFGNERVGVGSGVWLTYRNSDVHILWNHE